MTILLSFLLGALGLACLGLTGAKHHGWAVGRPSTPRSRAMLRIAATGALAASLAAAMAGWGAAQGSVVWFGLLALAAAMLLLLRTYAPWRPHR